LNDLLTLLAAMYAPRGLAKSIAIRAELPEGFLDLDGPPMQFWVEILQQARLRNKVHLLVDLAMTDYPTRAEELEAAKRTYLKTPREWRPAKQVSESLLTLAGVIRETPVRDVVVEYRVTFQGISRQIQVATAYKDLHERLHVLELGCYKRIDEEARGSSAGNVDWAKIGDAQSDLIKIVEGLKVVEGRRMLMESETSWVGEVSRAADELGESIELQRKLTGFPDGKAEIVDDELRTTIEVSSKKGLDQADWRLHRVLLLQPTPISFKLNRAVQDVGLDRLIGAMKRIHQALSRPEIEQATQDRFEQGVVALSRLERTIGAVVAEHYRWQDVEVILRMIEENLARDTSDLELSWPDLRTKVETLCGEDDDRSTRLKEYMDKLGAALSNHNPAQIGTFFQSFRNGAGVRFFETDTLLLNLIKSLGEVGESLNKVLEDLG